MAHNRVFKKYEFASEQEAEAAIAALPSSTDENGDQYPTHRHAIVKLGYLWTEQPTYDENGDVLTTGVQSDKYSVDVLWFASELTDENGDVIYPSGWESKEVIYDETWSNRNGAHTFAGWSFN